MILGRGRAIEPGEQAFYYDLSEAKLYSAPSGSLTPHEGIGGEPNDGVQAFVITCGGCTESDREIAYLAKMSDDLRNRYEERAARIARNEPAEGLLDDRTWINANQLVKRVDDPEWFPKSSPEGQRIVRLVRKKCDDGQYARICGPDD